MGEGSRVPDTGVGLQHKSGVWVLTGFLPPVFLTHHVSDPCYSGLQEKERLTVLERRYHSLTGGRPFPKTTSTLKEVMSPG